MTYGLNSDAKQIISGLKSRLGRTEERVTVLEGIVQSANAERDMYAERADEFEAERDQARDWAVQLEQQLARIVDRVDDLHDTYRARLGLPSTYNAGALDAVGIVRHLIADVTSYDRPGEQP